LLRGVERGFMPGVEQQQPLGALAVLARLLAVHVQTIGAAIDLRGARLDERKQPRIDAAVGEVGLDFLHRLDSFGRLPGPVQSLGHFAAPFARVSNSSTTMTRSPARM